MNKKIIFSFIIFLSLSFLSNAQCKGYIKSVAPNALTPYVMDANFWAPVIYEGDKIELTRTFLAHQKYKISVIGMEFFTKKITIKDEDGFILFKNFPSKRTERTRFFTDIDENQIPCFDSNYWEFELNRSQNLTIIIELERRAKKKKNRLKGCLGVVVGFAN